MTTEKSAGLFVVKPERGGLAANRKLWRSQVDAAASSRSETIQRVMAYHTRMIHDITLRSERKRAAYDKMTTTRRSR